MKRFEYYKKVIPIQGRWTEIEALNKLGEEGWELVSSMLLWSDSGAYVEGNTHFFKRELTIDGFK